MSLRDYVMPFDGAGDVCGWIRKVKLVASMEDKKLEGLLALNLHGDAFAVYEQMSTADQKDAKAIEDRLIEAFSLDEYAAYEKLATRRLATEETVDVFLTDLRRLARLAKIEDDELVKKAFVVGLPFEASSQLRASSRMDELSLSEIVVKARRFTSHRQGSPAFIAMKGRELTCFKCGDKGHIARNCPAKRTPVRTCWTCGQTGHVAQQCGQTSGNGKWDLRAPATSPQSHH
jgi:hypothetical protein